MKEPGVETETAPAPGEGRRKLPQELDRPGKIMVSGIPKREDYTENDLEREFAPFGRITEVNIIRDRRTSLPRGFAFITYENPQDSEDAIKAMEGKDFGGEAPVHCEQAVIGLRRRLMTEEGRGGRGARGGRFMDRGVRGRGMMDRGRGRGEGRGMMDRGRGMMSRGRGMMERGRGMMERGRVIRGRGGRFDDGQIYQEEEYYEDYYNGEPDYQGFPQRGRGIPPPRGAPPPRGIRGRGAPPGRGVPASHVAPPPRGSSGRKVLLPSPPVRGSRGGPFGGPGRMPPREEYYGEEADGYADGAADGYGEGYEEPYAEEGDYGAEEYYRERPAPVRRGTAIARGRGVVARGRPEPPARQLDEYGYPIEDASVAPRTTRPPAAAPRRAVPAYSEEMFEEEVDPYSTGRGRAPPAAAQSGMADPGVWGYSDAVWDHLPGARPVRPAGASRGATTAVASRRTALLGPDPYQEEAKGYERAGPMTGATASAHGYGDDPYADPYNRKVAPPASRQPAGTRTRQTLLPSDDMYATERIPAKGAQSVNDLMAARRAAASRFADDYQSSVTSGMTTRDAYGEVRRPVARREADYRAREDPYNRVAAETDAYVSYPSASKMTAESMARERSQWSDPSLMSNFNLSTVNDPYSRKRAMDMYDDGTDMIRSSAGVGDPHRDYDDYRPAAAAAPPVKRERMDRAVDRSVYEAYSSRQEGAYRGL